MEDQAMIKTDTRWQPTPVTFPKGERMRLFWFVEKNDPISGRAWRITTAFRSHSAASAVAQAAEGASFLSQIGMTCIELPS
jgi:hypothetical protein